MFLLQEEVYEKTTKKLVESVVDGYNGTVFAYGATGNVMIYSLIFIYINNYALIRLIKKQRSVFVCLSKI